MEKDKLFEYMRKYWFSSNVMMNKVALVWNRDSFISNCRERFPMRIGEGDETQSNIEKPLCKTHLNVN